MLTKSPSPARAAMPAMLRQSVDNIRDTFGIVRHRLATRPARYPKILWSVWVVAWLLLTIAVSLRFDHLAGTMARQWASGSTNVFRIAEFFTFFGLGGWYLVPSVLVLIAANLTDWRSLSRRARMTFYNWTCFAFMVLGSIALSAMVVNVLKYGVGRARPMNFDKLGDLSLHPFSMEARFASFPSGHATTMGVIFGIALLLLPQRRWVLLAATLSVASTRIFIGAHYPSDTVAGFGLGCAVAIVCAMVLGRLGCIFRYTASGLPVAKTTFRLFRRARKPNQNDAPRQTNFRIGAAPAGN
ncbi:phosphatase PAP2 family protein [Mesorhizobium sp. M0615]|uniref:phosphatase PAP2 family protein n=1 Tax=Mesorhizobium sp. M0615 TaxID=2956971 RepID=UPI0033381A1B